MKDERIDNYVMGRMSDEERLSFEQELLTNPELQQEVALHQDIVLAIQMKGAKEYAHKVRLRNRRTRVVRLVSYVAMAACIAVGMFHFNNVANYRSVGNNIMITEPGVRGGFDSEAIVAKIEDKEFKAALAMIAEEQSQLSAENPLGAVDNMELEWYKAVTYMRMGRWVKARRVLKQLAASDNPYYKKAAQAVLDKL